MDNVAIVIYEDVLLKYGERSQKTNTPFS